MQEHIFQIEGYVINYPTEGMLLIDPKLTQPSKLRQPLIVGDKDLYPYSEFIDDYQSIYHELVERRGGNILNYAYDYNRHLVNKPKHIVGKPVNKYSGYYDIKFDWSEFDVDNVISLSNTFIDVIYTSYLGEFETIAVKAK